MQEQQRSINAAIIRFLSV